MLSFIFFPLESPTLVALCLLFACTAWAGSLDFQTLIGFDAPLETYGERSSATSLPIVGVQVEYDRATHVSILWCEEGNVEAVWNFLVSALVAKAQL